MFCCPPTPQHHLCFHLLLPFSLLLRVGYCGLPLPPPSFCRWNGLCLFFSYRGGVRAVIQHLVSTCALVFLTSAAGSPVAISAAVLPSAQPQSDLRSGGRTGPSIHPKKFLLQRDSSVSLESASTLSSNDISNVAAKNFGEEGTGGGVKRWLYLYISLELGAERFYYILSCYLL